MYLHACSTHVSCNMHGFGTFSMHATCMLHDMHVTCIKQKQAIEKLKMAFLICVHVHRSRWDGVSVRLDVERVRTNTYMIYLAHTLFLTCIKHVMSPT